MKWKVLKVLQWIRDLATQCWREDHFKTCDGLACE
jgi:hypothetical protein